MIALILTATLWLHTTAELSDWYAEWLATPATSDVKTAELTDMERRHPCFPNACLAAPIDEVQIGTPLVVHTGMGSDVEQWRSIVAYFWPAEHVDRMLRIMRCESGGNPNAWNHSTDVRGLFQVKYPLWSGQWPGDYFDPWTNVAVAYQIWLQQGYRAWECKG